VTVIGVRVPYGESSPGMAAVVGDLRRIDPGYPTWVSGQPAITVDYSPTSGRTPRWPSASWRSRRSCCCS
jgi:hypothetical protein